MRTRYDKYQRAKSTRLTTATDPAEIATIISTLTIVEGFSSRCGADHIGPLDTSPHWAPRELVVVPEDGRGRVGPYTYDGIGEHRQAQVDQMKQLQVGQQKGECGRNVHLLRARGGHAFFVRNGIFCLTAIRSANFVHKASRRRTSRLARNYRQHFFKKRAGRSESAKTGQLGIGFALINIHDALTCSGWKPHY